MVNIHSSIKSFLDRKQLTECRQQEKLEIRMLELQVVYTSVYRTGFTMRPLTSIGIREISRGLKIEMSSYEFCRRLGT